MQVIGPQTDIPERTKHITQAPVPRPPQPIIVCRLEYSDVGRAAKTFQRAFTHDPVIRYVRNERPQCRHDVMLERLLIASYLVLWIRTKIVFTVGKGMANVVATPPRTDARALGNDPITNWVRRLVAALVRYRDSRISDLEKRRRTEVDEKMQDTVVRAFGSRAEKMWLIDELWTDPSRQGHGYGGTLLDMATSMADWAGQSTWLQSSNETNTRFYAQHGFQPAATLLLGNDDPSWHWPPVVVTIMVREPRWPPLHAETSR